MDLRIMTKYVCGIDLHARKMTNCVMDRTGKIFLRKEVSNSIEEFLEIIKTWQNDITIGVESTYNWYWLIDGLKTLKIPVYLGHALYIKRRCGLKHKTDPIDARHIADLLRTDKFPLAYAYPSEMRNVRDLLRRRHHLVRNRAGTYSHFNNTCNQHGYTKALEGEAKRVSTRREFPLKVTQNEDVQKILSTDIDCIESMDLVINSLEAYIGTKATLHNRTFFTTLLTIVGCGKITALTILYEMHTLDRFRSAQCFSSYCRVVRASNKSADKDYGRSSNDKIGNPYLKWALSEIVVHMIQQSALIRAWYDNHVLRYGKGGTQARLRHKLAVTIYQMLKHNQIFDEYKFLGIQNLQEQEEILTEQWTESSKQELSEPKHKRNNPPCSIITKRNKTNIKTRQLIKTPGRITQLQTGKCKVSTKSKATTA